MTCSSKPTIDFVRDLLGGQRGDLRGDARDDGIGGIQVTSMPSIPRWACWICLAQPLDLRLGVENLLVSALPPPDTSLAPRKMLPCIVTTGPETWRAASRGLRG